MNLARLIDPHPDDAPALIDESGAVVSYGALRRAVGAARGRLHLVGIGPDDRVAILSANDPAFVVAYLAILGLGAVAVPLNPASPRPELERELAQVDVKAVVIGPGGTGNGAEHPDGFPPVVTLEGPEGGADVLDHPVVERQPDDLAALMFTAGTAGAPRAAMLTHGSLLNNLDQVRRHPGQAIASADVLLGVLPLSHILGLNGVLGGALLAGASIVLVPRFDPRTVLELIDVRRVSIVVGAPSMFAALSAATDGAKPAGSGERLAHVRLAIAGAAPLTSEVADRWEVVFGCPLRQGYGLTEASPVVTMPRLDDGSHATSIGVPVPGVEVRLVDEEGAEALEGDPGEIWVRGPNVFRGYWEDERASQSTLSREGWLKTGDIAVIGNDGDLYIVDRAKDLIIVSGFNVYPVEVENALNEHPSVREVAVIGVPSATTGEAVKAFVVRDANRDVSEEQLATWAAERLARYKCPTIIEFVPELPHGLAGKLLRRQLRTERSGS